MPNTCSRCAAPGTIGWGVDSEVDAVVAVLDESSRATLQSADILLCFTDQEFGCSVIMDVLARYPGCAVVAAADAAGRWCLLATRGSPRPIVPQDETHWCRCVVESVARAHYDTSTRTGRP